MILKLCAVTKIELYIDKSSNPIGLTRRGAAFLGPQAPPGGPSDLETTRLYRNHAELPQKGPKHT